MKNETVGYLIKRLEKLDKDAVMCSMEMDDDISTFSTFDMCIYFPNVEYIDDSGEFVVGNIVAIY